MSDTVGETARSGTDLDAPVLQRLSNLDRFLPVWIVAAMAAGLLLGRLIPGSDDAQSAVEVGNMSLPIAMGARSPRRTPTPPSSRPWPRSVSTSPPSSPSR